MRPIDRQQTVTRSNSTCMPGKFRSSMQEADCFFTHAIRPRIVHRRGAPTEGREAAVDQFRGGFHEQLIQAVCEPERGQKKVAKRTKKRDNRCGIARHAHFFSDVRQAPITKPSVVARIFRRKISRSSSDDIRLRPASFLPPLG